MTKKDLRHSLEAMATLTAQLAQHREMVANIRERCEHKWDIHSQYPKPYGDSGKVGRWWIHFVCTVCQHSSSVTAYTPLCTSCQEPTVAADDDPRAAEAIDAAKKMDKYATHTYVFVCAPCDRLYGFPVRVDEKRK